MWDELQAHVFIRHRGMSFKLMVFIGKMPMPPRVPDLPETKVGLVRHVA
jgi:hypothetical protein